MKEVCLYFLVFRKQKLQTYRGGRCCQLQNALPSSLHHQLFQDRREPLRLNRCECSAGKTSELEMALTKNNVKQPCPCGR
jgi:hypothetical protein